MKMLRKLVSIVAAATLLTSSLAFSFSASAAEADVDSSVASEPKIQEKSENGVILHAFNWSYNSIKENLPQIAAAGYSTVQTSPVTQPKDFGMSVDVSMQWSKLYQPVSMQIAQSSWLGTREELAALCTEADKYGIKIIVDIVANHMANYKDPTSGTINKNKLSDEVKTYEPTLYNGYSTYFHSETSNASDSSTHLMVQGHVSDCPDLNTGNSTVQSKMLALLKDCIDCGVDGFRFDAAKHIETEKDGSDASSFWANTLDQAKSYYKSKNGGKELFAYGEILNGIGNRDLSGYTNRMRVTENKYSDNITAGVAKGSTNMASSTNYQLSGSASKAVVWAESHDTYMGESGSSSYSNTSGITDAQIARAWAIVAARKGSTPLFFARPGSAMMGQAAGDLSYKSTVVSEINKFHNAFASVDSEKVGVSGSSVYVARGTGGIVISNLSGNAGSVSISGTGLADGTDYVDTVTGNTFTVSGGTVSGSIGSTGVAVVYKSTATPKATASVETGSFTDDTMTVQLSLENAVSGTYALENSAPVTFTGSPTIRIGSDYNVGETITLNLTAKDAAGNTSANTYYYTKKAPTSSGIYVFLKPSLVSRWSNICCYVYDEDTSSTITYVVAGWPGNQMVYDQTLGYYYLEIPARCLAQTKGTTNTVDSDFDLPNSPNTYVIFNGTNTSTQLGTQYPAANAVAAQKLKLLGKSRVLDAMNASGWKETTMTPTKVEVQATDVTKGDAPITVPTETTTEEPTTEPEPATEFVQIGIFGDANGNGKVDLEDVTVIQRDIAEFDPRLTGDAKLLADVDRDGEVTIKDVTCIQMFLAEYPAQYYAHTNEPYGEYRPVDPQGEKFTVTATSNLFAENQTKLSKNTGTFTVTYFINSEKDLLSTDWLLTYDGTKLQPTNTNYMPVANGAVYNSDLESVQYGIKGNFSDINLVPLKTADNKQVALVTFIFRVLDPSDTTVNLNVTDLSVSKLNDGESTSKAANEEDIAEAGVVKKPNCSYELITSVYSGPFNESYTNSKDPKVVYNPGQQPTEPTDPTDPPIPVGTRKILFTNNKGWETVNIHYWGSSQGDTEWPGVEMTPAGTNTFGEPQYSFDIPTDVTGLIFNDGKAEGGAQTVDVDYDNAVTGWYPTDEQDDKGHWYVDNWISGEDPTEGPGPDPGTTKTIEFTDNQGWGTASIYILDANGNELTAWPGFGMNKKGDNGYGGTNYYYDVPSDASVVIFSDGKTENAEQTVDIPFDNTVTGYYPTVKNDEGKWEVDSWKSTDPDPQPGGTRTIFFTDNKGWGSVNIHYWGSSQGDTEWPGVEMTPAGTNTFGEPQYSFNISTDVEGMVFNNGSDQTVDVPYDGNATGWYPLDTKDSNGHYEVGSWSEGGTSGGGGSADGYYLVGFFDGVDYWGTDHPFSGGKVTMTFNETSYAFIRDAAGNAFMTNGFAGEDATSATLYSTDITGEKSDKLIAPAGTVTFTLTNNGDGTFTLSTDGTGGGEITETKTIEFTNTNNWDDVYVYVYTPGGEQAAWPGSMMELKGDNGYGGVNYQYAVPTNAQFIIFNNGKDSDQGGQQTVDVPFNSAIDGWYLTGNTNAEGKYEVGYWPTDEPVPSETKTVLFTNNNSWSKVYCYAWDDDEVKYLGEWPGTEMTDIGDNGYGKHNFSVEVPTSAKYLIFTNNSGQQTVDIPFDQTKTGWYLTGSGANNALQVGSW